jgi:hypothetical protein
MRWQEGLARRLTDTAQVIRPALNIVEGIVGREGTGFQRGRNRTLGLAVAGVNPVAVDSLTSYLMGFDPQHDLLEDPWRRPKPSIGNCATGCRQLTPLSDVSAADRSRSGPSGTAGEPIYLGWKMLAYGSHDRHASANL